MGANSPKRLYTGGASLHSTFCFNGGFQMSSHILVKDIKIYGETLAMRDDFPTKLTVLNWAEE